MLLSFSYTDLPVRLAVLGIELILTLGIVFWIRRSLRGHQESWKFVLQLLGCGALAAVISAFVEIRYSIKISQIQAAHPLLSDQYGGWYVVLNNFTASLIEELAKYLVALIAVLNSRHFYKLSTAIVYLILVGLGFTLIEDAIFLANPATIAPYRLISFFVHSGTSAIIGYSLGRFRFGLARYRDLAIALTGAVLLHFAYDLSVSIPSLQESAYFTLAVTLFISSRIIILFQRTLQEEYRLEQELFQPVPHTLLNINGKKGKASDEAVRHVSATGIRRL